MNARDRFGNTLTLQQVRWLAQLQTPIGLFGAHHARLMALLRSFQGAHAHQHSAEALQSLPVSREARLQRYRLQVHAFRLLLQLADPFGTRGLLFEPNAVGDTPADYLFDKAPSTAAPEFALALLFSSLLHSLIRVDIRSFMMHCVYSYTISLLVGQSGNLL